MRLVETWIDLGETRRRGLRSAISGTVKMCGLPAESVIMVPAFLSPRIVAERHYNRADLFVRLDTHGRALEAGLLGLHKAAISARQEPHPAYERGGVLRFNDRGGAVERC